MTSLNLNPNSLRDRASALRLHGVLAHWSELASTDWLAGLIQWEEEARDQRSLDRRIGAARIGRFKALADFDWHWPKQCDRSAIEALMALDFIKEGVNVVLRGPNGVGKSMLARNVAHQALVQGHTVRFTTAGELLGDLAALDSDAALRRRLALRRWMALTVPGSPMETVTPHAWSISTVTCRLCASASTILKRRPVPRLSRLKSSTA